MGQLCSKYYHKQQCVNCQEARTDSGSEAGPQPDTVVQFRDVRHYNILQIMYVALEQTFIHKRLCCKNSQNSGSWQSGPSYLPVEMQT